tara:strand:- start:1915 stop:2268 length:354 start_codon:yes stop_codon:yes gene_type:complete
MRTHQLEERLKPMLQDHIEIVSERTGKAIRRGTLILYSIKEFYVTLIIKTAKGETKQYHMPFPFDFELFDDRLVMDYKLQHVYQTKSALEDIVNELGESKSPFYDNTINVCRQKRTK